MDATLQKFRHEFRATRFRRGYSGPLHFATSMAIGLALTAGLLSLVHAPSWAELSAAPLTFLYANAMEYLGHRGPMHRRYRWSRLLNALFERHAAAHHRFFTRDAMLAESSTDWQVILGHPVFLVFFFGVIGLPSGLLLAPFVTTNVLCLFAATALVYALTYELLHLAYHLPPESWIGRLPGLATLRHHHQVHHDPRLMAKYNFNVTFPITDWVVGTWFPVRETRAAGSPPLSVSSGKPSGPRAALHV